MGNLTNKRFDVESAISAFFGSKNESQIANLNYEVEKKDISSIRKRLIKSRKDFLHIISQSGNTTSSKGSATQTETENGFIIRNVDIKKNKSTGQTFTEISTVQFFLQNDNTQVKMRNITIDRIEKIQHIERNSISFDLNSLQMAKRLNGSRENFMDQVKNVFHQLNGNAQLRLE